LSSVESGMQFSCLQVFSFILLLAGTGLIIASIATSNWTEQVYLGSAGLRFGVERGLWMQCTDARAETLGLNVGARDCKNRFEEAVQSKNVEDVNQNFQIWEIVCIALMGASALLGLLTLIFSPCCCTRCPCCLVLWSLLATLCCAAGVGTYAYEIRNNPPVHASVTTEVVTFGWSFWIAVAGGACQLVSTILFGVSRARVSYEYSSTI